MVHVYHASLEEAQTDPALAALFAPAPGTTPFDRLDWLRLLAEECLAPARCFIAVAREGERLAALPLCETPQGLASLANWYSFSARPAGSDPRLLAAIARDLAPHGRVLLSPLPAADAAALATALNAAGWFTRTTPAHVNRHLSIATRDFAAWWATRPGSLREVVRRKGRRIDIRIETRFDPADWATYEALYARSWKPAEGHPAFLRRFAEAEGAAGRLRLGIASHQGVPVAAQVWTVENGTAFIHKLAHDPAAAAHSPGTVLTHALFAMAFADPAIAEIDFGTGDDPYKRDWMDEIRPRLTIEAIHPRSVRFWPALARLLAARGADLARGRRADKAAR